MTKKEAFEHGMRAGSMLRERLERVVREAQGALRALEAGPGHNALGTLASRLDNLKADIQTCHSILKSGSELIWPPKEEGR